MRMWGLLFSILSFGFAGANPYHHPYGPNQMAYGPMPMRGNPAIPVARRPMPGVPMVPTAFGPQVDQAKLLLDLKEVVSNILESMENLNIERFRITPPMIQPLFAQPLGPTINPLYNQVLLPQYKMIQTKFPDQSLDYGIRHQVSILRSEIARLSDMLNAPVPPNADAYFHTVRVKFREVDFLYRQVMASTFFYVETLKRIYLLGLVPGQFPSRPMDSMIVKLDRIMLNTRRAFQTMHLIRFSSGAVAFAPQGACLECTMMPHVGFGFQAGVQANYVGFPFAYSTGNVAPYAVPPIGQNLQYQGAQMVDPGYQPVGHNPQNLQGQNLGIQGQGGQVIQQGGAANGQYLGNGQQQYYGNQQQYIDQNGQYWNSDAYNQGGQQQLQDPAYYNNGDIRYQNQGQQPNNQNQQNLQGQNQNQTVQPQNNTQSGDGIYTDPPATLPNED